MFCQKCGAKISDGAKFCNSCGQEIKVQSQEDLSFIKKSKPFYKRHPFLIILVVILIGVIGACKATSDKVKKEFTVMNTRIEQSKNNGYTFINDSKKIDLQHGQKVVIKGKVTGGNGTKSAKIVKTSFGDMTSTIFSIKVDNREYNVLLKTPEKETVYEKTVAVQGIIDEEAKELEPFYEGENSYCIVNAELLHKI